MLPRGPKRGGIRETVGFGERKAERGKGKDGRRIGGWCVAWGAVGRADAHIGPYGWSIGGAAGHIGPSLQRYIFVGQGPCALPDVQWAPCGA